MAHFRPKNVEPSALGCNMWSCGGNQSFRVNYRLHLQSIRYFNRENGLNNFV